MFQDYYKDRWGGPNYKDLHMVVYSGILDETSNDSVEVRQKKLEEPPLHKMIKQGYEDRPSMIEKYQIANYKDKKFIFTGGRYYATVSDCNKAHAFVLKTEEWEILPDLN